MRYDPAPRVSAGVKLLDEKRMGWEYEVNLASLDLSDSKECVLGQLYGHFLRALNELGLVSLADHGFSALGEQYEPLTAEWRRVLEERLSHPK